MAKTPEDVLIQSVSEELITYLGSGQLNTSQLAQSLDYSGLEIDDLERLKRLHFVLSQGVVDYVERLPERVRRLKTVNKREQAHSRGEVRGPVDWTRTLQQRYNSGVDDPTLFVIDRPEVEIDIPENRVVKKLLSVIARPLSEDIEGVSQDWRNQWDDADIVALQQLLSHNVHLDNLPPSEDISLSPRDLDAARRSRQRLYSEAERLYRLYQDLMNNRYERESVRELLQETMIRPTRTHKLYELFCVFAVIRRIRNRYNLRQRRVEPGMDEIAYLENEDLRVEVYYDQQGPLSFFESYPSSDTLLDQGADDIFVRQAQALESYERSVKQFLGKDSAHSFYSGRPDFLVLLYSKEGGDVGLDECIIGEIKYTESRGTFSDGLRELTEYMYFAKESGDYLFDAGDPPANIRGLLCTDGASTEVANVGSIAHLTTEAIQANRP